MQQDHHRSSQQQEEGASCLILETVLNVNSGINIQHPILMGDVKNCRVLACVQTMSTENSRLLRTLGAYISK